MRLPRRTLTVLGVAAGLGTASPSAQAIVGGQDAAAGEFPSVANVVIAGAFGCTGTLVAPRWVLTAGHCSSLTGVRVATPAEFPPQSFSVTVNGVEPNGSDGEKVTVDDVVIPSDYFLSDGYDVSLLRLSRAATTRPTPIAGRGYEALWRPDVLTDIVGFGVTKEGGDAPDTLQKAMVPRLADATCARSYPDSFEAQTQLCAGFPQGGTDTCQGDSGGPMFGRTAERALLVVGSTSYGDGCARPGKPGVYARVADVTLRDGFIRRAARDAVVDAPTPAPAAAASPSPSAPSPAAPAGESGTGAPSASSPSASSGTSSGPAAATRTSTGFRAALAVDFTTRRTVRARGLRFRLRCSAACSATVRLRVDGATARRLRLRTRTVGTTTIRRSASGRSTKLVRIARAQVRRVMAAKGASFAVVATVKQTPAGRSSVLTARAKLTGR